MTQQTIKDDATVSRAFHKRQTEAPGTKKQIFKQHKMRTKEIIDVTDRGLDIFQLEAEHGQVGALVIVASNVFDGYTFLDDFNCDKDTFDKCIVNLGMGYHERNPYHNALHAADVLQMANIMLTQTEIKATAQLEGIHLFSFLMSTIIHDLGHPGLNNAFMVARNDALAIEYNDRSVLENFHVAQGFRIIS